MAERSIASLAGAGWPACRKASNRMCMPVGEVRSAAALGTKVNPVIAPLALKLTTAVACCHSGLLAGCTSTPPSDDCDRR
jgi:hypothetical protein